MKWSSSFEVDYIHITLSSVPLICHLRGVCMLSNYTEELAARDDEIRTILQAIRTRMLDEYLSRDHL